MGRKGGERLTCQRTADAVDDNIHAASPRNAGDAISETVRGEIDDIVKAEGPCLLGLGWVGRRRDRLRCALGSGQLRDSVTDRATDCRRQNALAGLEARL